jgi:hypothetical protein
MNDRNDGMPSGEEPSFSPLAPLGVGGDSTTFAPDDVDRSLLSWEVGCPVALASQLEAGTHVQNEFTRARELALLLAENSNNAENSSGSAVRLAPAGVFRWAPGCAK